MIASVPPESAIVVSPEYVFVPASVSVPDPLFVKVNEPETAPLIVADCELATCTVEFAASATVLPRVPPAVKFTAPALETPVPEIVKASATV